MSVLDFAGVVRSGGVSVYPDYGRSGHWIALPHALDVGRRPDGSPDFQLDMVRSRDGSLAGYGVLDFRVVPVVALEAAQGAAPGGSVEAGTFSGGWLRLEARDPGAAETTLVLPPLRIASNGLGVVRLAAQLTSIGASLMKQALLGGSVLVDAWAEMEVEGVSPRIPATVTLILADLVKAIVADPKSGLFTRADVVNALSKPGVLQGLPSGADVPQAADAVADRLRNMIGSAAPSSQPDFSECWRIDFPAPDTRFQFDLGVEAQSVRTMALRFDPVALARGSSSANLERLIVERELSDFATGYLPLLVTANLLDRRSSVLSCGVDLVAPPKPPDRMGVIRQSVEFQAPRDRADLILRFGANEKPVYQFETFVVTETDAGIHEWRAPRREHSGGELRLSADDFAARFLAVTASPQLLAEGTVEAAVHFHGETHRVTLTDSNPADALVCDPAAHDATFECRLRRGARELVAAVNPAGALYLDLPLFAEHGLHTVQIEMTFDGTSGLVALELTPEDEQERAAQTVAFTPSKPARSWTWFAKSPFAPGFCYRLYQSGGAPLPWSAPQSAFQPLRLRAADFAGAGGLAAGQAS